MIPRQLQNLTPENCAFMQLRNGKIVGLSLLNSSIDGVLDFIPPGSQPLVLKRESYTTPCKPIKAENNITFQERGSVTLVNKDGDSALSKSDNATQEDVHSPECEGLKCSQEARSLSKKLESGGELMECGNMEADQDQTDLRLEKSAEIAEEVSLVKLVEVHSEEIVTSSTESDIINVYDSSLRTFQDHVVLSSTPLPGVSVQGGEKRQVSKQNKGRSAVACNYVFEKIDEVSKTSKAQYAYQDASSDYLDTKSLFTGGVEQHAFVDLSKKAHESILCRLSDTLRGQFSFTYDSTGSDSPPEVSRFTTDAVSKAEVKSLESNNEYKAYVSSNHARWSELHHRRREWYLNRFSRRRTRTVHIQRKRTWYETILYITRLFYIAIHSRFANVRTGFRESTLLTSQIGRKLTTIVENVWIYINSFIRNALYTSIFGFLVIFRCIEYVYLFTVRRNSGWLLNRGPTFGTDTTSVKRGEGWVTCWIMDFLETKLRVVDGSFSKFRPFAEQTEKEKEDTLQAWKYCCTLGLLLFAGLICLLLLVYWNIFYPHPQVVAMKIPRPEEVGLRNTHNIFLNFQVTRIPAWHVLPSLYSGKSSIDALGDGSPVFLHLRKTELMTAHHRVQVYNVLSSLGYHVLVPVFQLSSAEAKLAWKWVRKQTNMSNVFLWGDNLETSDITTLAKDLCKDGVPPAGVVIEIEPPKASLGVTTLEVWSCNCTTSNAEKPEQYGHVKCPLRRDDMVSMDDLYTAISRCLTTIMLQ